MPRFRVKQPSYEYEAEDKDIDEEPPKKKRNLSDKQLEALAKGRARVAENRLLKNKTKKEDSKFCEDGIKQRREAVSAKRQEKKREIPITATSGHRAKLKAREDKLSNWSVLKDKCLTECKTTSDYDDLSNHLNTITEEDVIDGDLLLNKLNNIYSNYKE